MSESVLSIFSSKSFIVSGLMFRYLIHFEFIFVYAVRNSSSFILLPVVDQISQPHLLKRLSLIHCIFLPPLSKIRCPYVRQVGGQGIALDAVEMGQGAASRLLRLQTAFGLQPRGGDLPGSQQEMAAARRRIEDGGDGVIKQWFECAAGGVAGQRQGRVVAAAPVAVGEQG